MLPYLLGRIGLRQVRRYCLTGAVFDAAVAQSVAAFAEGRKGTEACEGLAARLENRKADWAAG